jgi:hypothetical protein
VQLIEAHESKGQSDMTRVSVNDTGFFLEGTYPAKTPPSSTKKVLMNIFHQNSGEPSSSPGPIPVLLISLAKGNARLKRGIRVEGEAGGKDRT